MKAGNEKGKMKWRPSETWSYINHDRAESQIRHQRDRQAPLRDLADQGPGGAGVRAAAPHHQKAGQHARGCTETAAGLTLGKQAGQKLFRIPCSIMVRGEGDLSIPQKAPCPAHPSLASNIPKSS